MSKIPLYYQDNEFYNDFGTSCYINHEKMVDVFPLYRHDFIEISLILEGNGVEICNGKRYLVEEGCVSVAMPWHFHTIHTEPDRPITRFICEFSMEEYLQTASVWPKAREALFDHSLEHMVKLSEKDLSRSVAIFNEMYDCFTDESNPDRQTLLYMKLVEFMMLFYRAQTSTPVRAQSGAPGADGAVYDALRHIHQFFNTELSLSSVAKTVGMAPSSLREQLLAYTGQEFQQLLTDIRVRNACILLGLKTPTIKYIAQNTGFGTVQTFYRIFRERKGMTPEEFRKKHWMESEGKAGYLMYNNQIWKLLYYLHRNFDEEITPESAAEAMGVSVSHLHKSIKYNLMQSFSQLLREIRVGYACGLLTNPALSVEQVAIEVGYNNSKTFTRAFQKQMGVTPSEYRAKAAASHDKEGGNPLGNKESD